MCTCTTEFHLFLCTVWPSVVQLLDVAWMLFGIVSCYSLTNKSTSNIDRVCLWKWFIYLWLPMQLHDRWYTSKKWPALPAASGWRRRWQSFSLGWTLSLFFFIFTHKSTNRQTIYWIFINALQLIQWPYFRIYAFVLQCFLSIRDLSYLVFHSPHTPTLIIVISSKFYSPFCRL